MLALSLLGFAAAASALALQNNGINLPLPLADISWTAPSEHGNVTFTGSQAEVIAQIAALVPRWQSNETYYGELVNQNAANAFDANGTAHGVAKRSNRVNQFCKQYGWNSDAMPRVDTSMTNLSKSLKL